MKHPQQSILPTPVLEIGGTHVTAALVLPPAPAEGANWAVLPGTTVRRDLDAHATAEGILDAIAEAANLLGGTGYRHEDSRGRGTRHGEAWLGAHTGEWGVALPGPFDYRKGIALYEHVGKFDSLRGVDVGAGLAERLARAPRSIVFLNDADAFGIGEYAIGVGGSSRRTTCITLGTGVGSTFLADGVPVKSGPDVPPDGSCYLLDYDGRPLEETVSRRAIRSAYAAAGAARDGGLHRSRSEAQPSADVREIAEASRAGDALAAGVLGHAFAAVGEAAGPYLRRFGAEVLIVGGSMSGSWDIVEPAIRQGLCCASPELAALPIMRAARSEEAGLVGAAYYARSGVQS